MLNPERIQSLLDSGKSISEIGRMFNEHHQTIIRFIDTHGLERDYLEDISGYLVNDLEIARAFRVDGYYEIEVDNELLNYLEEVSEEEATSFRKRVRLAKEEAELELIDNFVKDICPSMINSSNLRNKYHKIGSLIYKHFKSIHSFRRTYNLYQEIPLYSSHKRNAMLISLGLEFEELLRKHVFTQYPYQVTTKKCRPDFIVGNMWVDAKLCKGTILNSGDDTIEKYLKETDRILIVYALDNGEVIENIPPEVTLMHVSDFYSELESEEVAIINDFIERAGKIKGTSN